MSVEEEVVLGEVEVDRLKLSALNPRKNFDDAKIKDLAASITEKGIITPLVVRKIGEGTLFFEIVCGARRYKAAKMAKLVKVPVLIRELDDRSVLEIMSIENLQREDVHPLEEAEGYEKLIKDYRYEVKDLAAKVGKGESYIYQRLKLCELIPENRKLFYEGKFSPSVALLVARIPAHLQKDAGKKIVSGRWGNGGPMSHAEASDFIAKDLMLELSEAPFDTKDSSLAGKGSCVDCLKRTGNEPSLFPDIKKKDTCTDPACFARKKNAAYQRQAEQFKQQGKKVLSEKEAHELGQYQCPYHRLSENCRHDPKGRSYGELVKPDKAAETAVALVDGKAVPVIAEAQFKKVCEKLKYKFSENRIYDKAAAGERKKEQLRKDVRMKLIAAVNAKVVEDKAHAFFKIFAERLIYHISHDGKCSFVKRHYPDVKREAASEKLDDHFKLLQEKDYLPFCVEMLMHDEGIYAHSDGYSETAEALAKVYKIDVKKIEAGVKAAKDAKKK